MVIFPHIQLDNPHPPPDLAGKRRERRDAAAGGEVRENVRVDLLLCVWDVSADLSGVVSEK
jgi:hypothetical protein